MSKSEENYVQIEKELLAIVFACSKYHQYIYAKPVIVETDHKPLEYIFRKPLTAAPPRLQRMLLTLQKYDLDVIYKPGKSLFIADTLSRAPRKQVQQEQATSDELYQVHTVQHLPMTPEKLEQFRAETLADPVLQKLQRTAHNGWPSEKSSVDLAIREYWSVRDEINQQDGILLRGERLIVPSSLRKEMLHRIHESHFGIERCKRRARDVLYWPGMNDQIAQLISRCDICQRFRKAQQKEPMRGHEIPGGPWQKVGLDLFEDEGESYLAISDYYSKFFEITKLTTTTSASTIKHIKPHFARHGIPEEVISDNGPQFSSAEFANFAKQYEFKHTTSSPTYPQSNGLAERTVETAKNILKKAREDRKDPNIALLDFRNTPIDGVGLSPAQLLMGRRTRTRLPTSPKLLKPMYDADTIRTRLTEKQQKQKSYYDKTAKPLPTLQPGEHVRLRNDDKGVWVPATVKRATSEPRSYVVESNGRDYRRNRRHILKEPAQAESHEEAGATPASPISTPVVETAAETTQSPSPQAPSPQDGVPVTTRSGRVVKTPVRYINCS